MDRVPISDLCRLGLHHSCNRQLDTGLRKNCACGCHVIKAQSKKPPTLSFDHRVEGHQDVKIMLNDIGNIIGAAIREKFPNMGFALMMFDFGDGGSFFWLSNAQRQDMIKMLQEALEKLGPNK